MSLRFGRSLEDQAAVNLVESLDLAFLLGMIIETSGAEVLLRVVLRRAVKSVCP